MGVEVFKKYPSIENAYRKKFIDKMIKVNPGIENDEYIILEKIHGANFQVIILSDGNIKYASRNRLLTEEESFYGYQKVVSRIMYRLSYFIEYAKHHNTIVRLYGELFGDNVQKGVYYNAPDNDIRFFDVNINDSYLSAHDMIKMFETARCTDLLVPIIDVVEGVDNAVNYNEKFLSKLNPIDNNYAEGIIIRPFRKEVYNKVGQRFILKKKIEKFAEVQRKPKIKKVKVLSEREQYIEDLHLTFLSYININRVQSVLSKEGLLEVGPKDYGRIIKLIIEDAKEDFLKDYNFNKDDFEKKELKYIFNAGKQIIRLIEEVDGGR